MLLVKKVSNDLNQNHKYTHQYNHKPRDDDSRLLLHRTNVGWAWAPGFMLT